MSSKVLIIRVSETNSCATINESIRFVLCVEDLLVSALIICNDKISVVMNFVIQVYPILNNTFHLHLLQLT